MSLARFGCMWVFGTGMATFAGGCYDASQTYIRISPQ